jgi:phospholipase C
MSCTNMESRREFLKKAALLSGSAGLMSTLPPSIQRALAIDPKVGSSYLDAEHVVILMQENRSFDHSYGTLKGVRGFNDPRCIQLPNKNLAWLQTNEEDETYLPFRLNIKETNATWMGSLPHSWPNQVDARNDGKYDKWLIAKKPGREKYSKMPLTQGYYNREDIPFYYAFADSFTVCDQSFCSSLTGTTPNRLYLWSGTVRAEQNPDSYANISNENVDEEREASWKTFPERLEDENISWRIYQNELSIDTGFTGEEEGWLANFTNNPIEWFSQYQIRFHSGYQNHLKNQIVALPEQIKELEDKLKSNELNGADLEKAQKSLRNKKELLSIAHRDLARWSPENFEKLTQYQKNIHQKAFTTNVNQPEYRKITEVKYYDGDIENTGYAPQADVMYQFRTDVNTGKLPTVSWLVAPKNFSDHPGAPWYGAWYVSETLDILTQNPEVWKKTIFILCYDENDGYFDHVPPYVVPNPYMENTGKVSKGIDAKVEFVTQEQDMRKRSKKDSRESPIGLGYRVPLVVASPWNREGSVCSEVFDHTSILMFLDKTGKKIEEPNISTWRRTICGDLSSTFKPYHGEKIPLPKFVEKNEFMESIHNAQYKKFPSGYRPLSDAEIKKVNDNPADFDLMPRQEKGTKPSCAIPYELYADGNLNPDTKTFEIKLEASNQFFGKNAKGAPFNIYATGKYQDQNVKVWNYAVSGGDHLNDKWTVADFENGHYQLRVNAPNGFMRAYEGNAADPQLHVTCAYEVNKNKKPTGNLIITVINLDKNKKNAIQIVDNAYKRKPISMVLAAAALKGSKSSIIIPLKDSHNWYDFTLMQEGNTTFMKRFAGHVETGELSQSDPFMGGVI